MAGEGGKVESRLTRLVEALEKTAHDISSLILTVRRRSGNQSEFGKENNQNIQFKILHEALPPTVHSNSPP